jgi:light-regulated signal transduction histidine kinase (bacteriophytochrome)
MTPAPAKTVNTNALEELGRATLQIVHDLKNQLNGLKLYATFLRKRVEREDRSPEERETLIKLIAGLDRAARDMTALVRYSQPVELHRRPRTDLRILMSAVVKKVIARAGVSGALVFQIDGTSLFGEFDALALSEALQSLTEEAVDSLSSREPTEISLHARREGAEAVIEWRGVKPGGRNHSLRSSASYGTVYTAQAARIIEAHDGRFECDATTIRAWLPLSE